MRGCPSKSSQRKLQLFRECNDYEKLNDVLAAHVVVHSPDGVVESTPILPKWRQNMRIRLVRSVASSVLPALMAVLLWSFLTSCSSSGRRSPETKVPVGGVALVGAGSTFDSILFQSWFTIFQHDNPNAYISYDVVGSGEGVRRFIGRNIKDEDRVDFGASDAAMTDDEIALVDQGVLMVPITAGGVVLAYNLPGFVGELKLSRRAYAGIFLGEITNWKDKLIAESNPGVKLPDFTITTVVRRDGSGTTYAFTKHLDAISDKWRARYGAETLVDWPGMAMRAPGNEGVAGRIQQSMGSIGYIEYGFAQELHLKTAILENKEGKFVRATGLSIVAALAGAQLPNNLRAFVPDPSGSDSYPIVTYSWVLLRKNYPDAAKAKLIHDLFSWCLQDGQRFAPVVGYVPLPATVAVRGLSALDSITLRK
jgi:phosphate transport system substrate-binding protein